VTEAYRQDVISYTADLKSFTQLSEADVRRFIESELYREKVRAAVITDLPATKEERHLRHILVADEVLAKTIVDQLRAGEDFATLALQYSTDPGSKDTGGDLGWSDGEGFVPEFREAAFKLELNAISDPVQSEFGWHIIQVLGRRDRPLAASELETKREEAFTSWLQTQRDAGTTAGTIQIFDVWQDRVPRDPDLNDLNRQP
jgi:parvulin-like peptidyl-prolyl isomerase